MGIIGSCSPMHVMAFYVDGSKNALRMATFTNSLDVDFSVEAKNPWCRRLSSRRFWRRFNKQQQEESEQQEESDKRRKTADAAPCLTNLWKLWSLRRTRECMRACGVEWNDAT